jgi:digeranylgeranylglycerophospholipid reductase
MHDVTIVGGGPGGLATAARLAAAGHSVTLVEEHPGFGDPVHCTGVLADDAFDELGVGRGVVLNPLSTARFHSPSGLDICYTSPSTEAVVIDRVAFDQQLAAAASDAGATLLTGARATSVDVQASHVRVTVDGHTELRSRAVVLACGANYRFQQELDLGAPSVHLASAQLELPAARTGDVEVYFGSELAPRGFAWAVPVTRPDGYYLRLGVMCQGNAAEHFRRLVEKVGTSWGIDPATVGAPRRRLLPLTTIRRTYGARVLAVGDAAGLVKPTTGGGIYYSLVSASLAAEILDGALRRDDLSAPALQPYERAWRGRLNPEFRAQLALRLLAQRLPDRAIDALWDLARTDGIMPIVRSTARFNKHRDLIVALFRHPGARRVLFRRLVA